MDDIAGNEIEIGSWVAYATRSWGQHALKLGRVIQLDRLKRPRSRYFDRGFQIEAINVNGKRYTCWFDDPSKFIVVPKNVIPEALQHRLVFTLCA